jgi:predicted SnoaL-like aldol condensation-catalyzing enzyme
MSAEEKNKAIFRRYVEEVVNQGNLDLADEIFDRYVAQPNGLMLERGPEDVKRFLGEFHAAFPNFHAIIEDQIAEGDRVMTRYRWRGTHGASSGVSRPRVGSRRSTASVSSASHLRGRWSHTSRTSPK